MNEEPIGEIGPPWTFLDLVKVILVSFGVMVLMTIPLFASGLALDGVLLSDLIIVGFYACLMYFGWRLALRRRGAGWSDAGFRPAPSKLPLLVFGWYVVGLFAQGIAFAISDPLLGQGPGAEEQLGISSSDISIVVAIATVIAAVIVAPVVEEFLFRGLLYRYLKARMPIPLAMVCTALPFAVAHVFLPLIPALFAFGLVLNYVAERYDSLYPSIGLHMLQNGVAVAIVLS